MLRPSDLTPAAREFFARFADQEFFTLSTRSKYWDVASSLLHDHGILAIRNRVRHGRYTFTWKLPAAWREGLKPTKKPEPICALPR